MLERPRFLGNALSYGLRFGLGSCFKEKKKNTDGIHEKQVGTFAEATQLEVGGGACLGHCFFASSYSYLLLHSLNEGH